MLYKIRFRPDFSILAITLKPGEKLAIALAALVSLDEGLAVKKTRMLGLFPALLYRLCGGYFPPFAQIHNPTEEPLSLVLSKTLPGDIIRLDLTKTGICLVPGAHIAHTSGAKLNLQWVGFSSWLAGQGLFALKLSGKGRVFLGSYGQLIQRQVHQRLVVEQGHLVAYSGKLKLKANFPKGLVGNSESGEGVASQLQGGGIVYLQSRSCSGMARYLRLQFR
ncbi:MAG: TIGR00266 family protein [Cyanobacteria bacterium RI_101]|nr:TIGR00266 family protein [Cyanobacteria bacterium RI_101]